jgi:hypothetical protein
VRQVSIPKNGIAAPCNYLEGKYDKQQFYSQELQGVDAVEENITEFRFVKWF